MAHTRFVSSVFATAVALAIVGCDTTTTQPPTPTPEPVRETQVAPANPKAAAAEQQAAQQAKAIDELLAARTQSDAQDQGLTIVEPAKSNLQNQSSAQTPLPVAPAAPVAAKPNDDPIPPPTIPKIDPPPAPKTDTFRALPDINAVQTPANTGTTIDTSSTAVANHPTDAPAPIRDVTPPPRPAATSGLEPQIAQRANEYPRDVAAQLDNQILGYLKDQGPTDAAALGQLPTEDREIVTAIVDGLTNFRTGVRNDNNMLMNRKIRPLEEMADRLKSRADLSITNALLCTSVQGFGMYTPFDPARLVYGEPSRKLIVYCEVENFASQLDDKGLWTTKLQMDLVLYSNGGMDVWHQKGIAVNDTCRNHRHDFFIAARVAMPGGLAIDQYSLKITISDLNANRVAETTIPVGVVDGQK